MRKRHNQAGGFTPEARKHAANLRYIAIAGRLRQGSSQAEVCAEFNVSRGVVFMARQARNVPPNRGRTGKPSPWLCKDEPSPHVMERLRMLASGMNQTEVAAKVGVTKQAIGDCARRWKPIVDQLKAEMEASE